MPKIVTEEDRQHKRRLILDAAASEIARVGYDRANINTIAENAGMGRGTIYLYFGSKEEVLDVLLEAVGSLLDDAVGRCAESDAPWPERLRDLARTFADLARDHRDFFRVHVSALHGVNREIGQPVARWLRRSVDRLAAALREAIARGEVHPVEPETLALLVLGMLESLALLPDVLGMPDGNGHARADLTADLLWSGIMPRVGSAAQGEAAQRSG